MLPVVTWLSFAITAYVLWTVVFRVRYGFSPVAERFPPRNLYGWMDFGLAGCLIGYSVWIVFGAAPEPMLDGVGTWIGLALWALGAGLRLWAVLTLGRNWRIGQADNDERAEFVAGGPYRLMHHPINVALVLVAMGQTFMTGLNLRSMVLLAFATVYLLVQAGAEERHWAGKRGS